MAKNRRKPTLRVLVAILMLLVFSGFYFLLAPLVHEVGEGDVQVNATLPEAAQTQQSTVNKSSEYLILVNKNHSIKNYKPKDLKKLNAAVPGISPQFQRMRKVAANAFNDLTADAKRQGYTIKVTTGYRSYSYQKTLHDQYVKKDGQSGAEQYSAKPGYSEHQSGLAADVSSPCVNYNLVQAYGTTHGGKWLAKNAHKYGFIIRYPNGKEKITGYEYEPWHIRYVGKDAAKEIYDQKTTLEEYLGEV